MQKRNNLFSTRNAIRFFQAICLIVLLGFNSGGTIAAQAATQNPDLVQTGDVVQVDVTVTAEDGSVVYTTRRDVLEDVKLIKHPSFSAPEPLVPEAVVAGGKSRIPGLGKAVVGLIPGVTKIVTVPPEEAFGKPDPSLRKDFPCERVVPKTLRLPAQQYLQWAGTFPKEGESVDLIPYMQGHVAKVEDTAVILEFTSEDGRKVSEDFGTVSISVSEEEIRTRLDPKLGAAFPLGDKTGRIVSSDGDMFTVDFNPPQMNQSLTLDFEVVSRLPAQSFATNKIEWQLQFDKGLKVAEKENKPVVLVLYADWCQWCKRFLGESVEDARVKSICDQFVWMKINSDVEKQFKEKFGQSGFPMVVLLSPKGETLKKIEGFEDGATFYRNLRTLPVAF